MIKYDFWLLGSCFAGLLAGLLTASFFGRKRLNLERNTILELKEELDKERGETSALKDHLQDLVRQEAKLEEQATRIPGYLEELKSTHSRLDAYTKALADLRQKYGAAQSAIESRNSRIERNESKIKLLESMLGEERNSTQDLKSRLAAITAKLEEEQKQNIEKLALLEEAKGELSNRFKSLASDILDEKSKRFTAQNQTNLKQILDPLKTGIAEFKNQVERSYHQEGKDRSELAAQVKQLMTLNKQLSDDAHNLTDALKGQSKTRGDWGELILERVLEVSGLRKDHEYTVQENHLRENGTRVQPDVVVHLPGDKHLIVDSKVSLVAYLKYTEADNSAAKNIALKNHIASIKTHISGLSSKNYQDLYGIKSPDFVIMFIPIEPAFALASSGDAALWQEAWNKNVLIVSPSTLLFVIRTVAHIWRQEKQNQNAQEIAERGSRLYDKFQLFVDDIEKIGERIRQTQETYEKARNKLCVGSGNLIRQAEMLRELGVKPKKNIKSELLEEAMMEENLPALEKLT